MIDVHPPSEPIHGWRDFFLHLTTITIGLLIALSLEGCVEWQHHRHLVREAEVNLHREIVKNTGSVHDALDNLHKRQKQVEQDVVVLTYVVKNHKYPAQKDMQLSFNWGSIDSVGWQTAQSTGALSYMPYSEAQEFALIYDIQRTMQAAEQQSTRDTIVTTGVISSSPDDGVAPTQAQAEALLQSLNSLEIQLKLEEFMTDALATSYKGYLARHPN